MNLGVLGGQIEPYLVPYFQALNENSGGYGVGVYGSRNVCETLVGLGLAETAFVSDMSYGFSGNLGFPIPQQWNYDQFAEISNYKGQGWDLDRVAWSGRMPPCRSLLQGVMNPKPSKNVAEAQEAIDWTLRVQQAAVSTLNANNLSAYEGQIGRYVLSWLRKPQYWNASPMSGLLWQTYTPEPNDDANAIRSRNLCSDVCSTMSPNSASDPKAIVNGIHSIDVAHMAATTLGYLQWGVPAASNRCGLGDLGGWALDLLQLWGTYNENTDGQLEQWAFEKIGAAQGSAFGDLDVLADADAWLLAKALSGDDPETLPEALALLDLDPAERMRRFYQGRFGGSSANLVSAFQSLCDGIDIGIIDNVVLFDYLIERAAGARTKPTPAQAAVLSRALAEYLD